MTRLNLAEPPPDPGTQHQPPPIFYCWKYWLSNGDIAEGCTSVDVIGQSTMPDLNMYGWMYIVVPLAGVLLLLSCCMCCFRNKKHKNAPEVLVEDDDSSDLDEVLSSPYPRSPPHAVPNPYHNINMNDPRQIYTVVNLDGKPEKVPINAGVPASSWARLYPRLSSMKRSNKSIAKKRKTPSPTAPPAKEASEEPLLQKVVSEERVADDKVHERTITVVEDKSDSESEHEDEVKVASESEHEDERKSGSESEESETEEKEALLQQKKE